MEDGADSRRAPVSGILYSMRAAGCAQSATCQIVRASAGGAITGLVRATQWR